MRESRSQVRVDSIYTLIYRSSTIRSNEADVKGVVLALWRGSRRRRSQKPSNARASLRLICITGDRKEGSARSQPLPLVHKATSTSLLHSSLPLRLTSIQQISFARTRSDAVVKKLDQSGLEQHKATRLEHKRMWKCLFCVVFETNKGFYRENAVLKSLENEVQGEAVGNGGYEQTKFIMSWVTYLLVL